MNNPKPSLKANPRFQDQSPQRAPSHLNNMLYGNIDDVPDFLLLSNERPFNKPSSTLHMGPHLRDERDEADPKLKALGTEIAKKVGDIRIRDSDVVPLEFEEESPIIGKHGFGGKKPNNPQISSDIKPKTLPQDDIRKGERAVVARSLEDEQIFQQNLQNLKEKEELRRQLELTTKELERVKEALVKNSAKKEGGEELQEAYKESDRLAIQLNKADQVYGESIKVIEGLVERIKTHLMADLKFYEKIEAKMENGEEFQSQAASKKGGDKEKEWLEMQYIIFGMRRECQDILKRIGEKSWRAQEVEEAKEFIEKVQDNRVIKTENSKLKSEERKSKAMIQKLDTYIKELEEEVNNLANDSKNANKNNLKELLKLKKEHQGYGKKEIELREEMENLRSQLEELLADHRRRASFESKQKEQELKVVEELQQQIKERDEIGAQVQEQMLKLLKRNQAMKEKLDTYQEEIDSVKVQLSHYKEKEVNMYSMGMGMGTQNQLQVQPQKIKGKSNQSSIASLGDVNKADMEWLKARVGETTDWMMMLHLQASAIEDNLKMVEEFSNIGNIERLRSPDFMHNNGNNTQNNNGNNNNITPTMGQSGSSRFSFGEYLGLK